MPLFPGPQQRHKRDIFARLGVQILFAGSLLHPCDGGLELVLPSLVADVELLHRHLHQVLGLGADVLDLCPPPLLRFRQRRDVAADLAEAPAPPREGGSGSGQSSASGPNPGALTQNGPGARTGQGPAPQGRLSPRQQPGRTRGEEAVAANPRRRLSPGASTKRPPRRCSPEGSVGTKWMRRCAHVRKISRARIGASTWCPTGSLGRATPRRTRSKEAPSGARLSQSSAWSVRNSRARSRRACASSLRRCSTGSTCSASISDRASPAVMYPYSRICSFGF